MTDTHSYQVNELVYWLLAASSDVADTLLPVSVGVSAVLVDVFEKVASYWQEVKGHGQMIQQIPSVRLQIP